MSVRYVEIAQALNSRFPIIDVRTPAEFKEGHIPGASNLPLFTNEERAAVGTLYKQKGPEEAFLQGLEFTGPKMRYLAEQGKALARNGGIMVHCWRGGQRSSSVGWLLAQAGLQVAVIRGGYKAYRAFVQQGIEAFSGPLMVIGGPTGSGKTEVLYELDAAGEQTLDLEGLANHKGSAFGAFGEPDQPSVTHFENLLFARLSELDPARWTWVENESKAIGRVYLPASLCSRMEKAPLFDLRVPLPDRLDRLVGLYAAFPAKELEAAFMKIKKRLGGQNLKAALEALNAKDYRQAAAIALRYYDKAYAYYARERQKHTRIIPVVPASGHAKGIADQLIALAREEQNYPI
ncbi:tRNA 2-selenouridine(34) synthase MnmH [Phaeodactylibacter luteus]|uniref:tRNA 2-selenouridine(34) synthase MnmH n=1 Tax=Phaeodactylibacter luteus TaxID=1564516 RepID=A0A5C6RQC5_9BACT|nr:tRNA 2-selenouridine(34) synthase MnmH [Phaeodactylibacter luteus]TXB63592.1 tRNA 2-selenouridine(34) synthase MnmH [Phaeodactylibacter luteus]